MKKYKFKHAKSFKLLEGSYLVSSDSDKIILNIDYWNRSVKVINLQKDKKPLNKNLVTEITNFGMKMAARKSKVNLVR